MTKLRRLTISRRMLVTIVGLDMAAAKEAFSAYLDETRLDSRQIDRPDQCQRIGSIKSVKYKTNAPDRNGREHCFVTGNELVCLSVYFCVVSISIFSGSTRLRITAMTKTTATQLAEKTSWIT